MSAIYCSTKLSTLIGKNRLNTVEKLQPPDPQYGWNAQLFHVQGKKCVIVTNKATLYSFVRVNILKRDFTDLKDFFNNSLLTQLRADELYDSDDFWQPFFDNLNFYTTDNDKKVIGSINDLIFQLQVAIDYNSGGLGVPTDTTAASYLNNSIMGLIKNNRPIEILRAKRNNA